MTYFAKIYTFLLLIYCINRYLLIIHLLTYCHSRYIFFAQDGDQKGACQRGDLKCGSGKCDTGKIARVENAGVEKAGVDSRGGKCGSKLYGTPN